MDFEFIEFFKNVKKVPLKGALEGALEGALTLLDRQASKFAIFLGVPLMVPLKSIEILYI
jgi:hypothetical protein